MSGNFFLPFAESRRFIFFYHDVSDEKEPHFSAEHYSTTVSNFKKQIRFLTRKYEIVPLDVLVTDFDLSRKKHYASVVFDDGFFSVAETALKILAAEQIPFAVFVNKAAIVFDQLWVSNLILYKHDEAYLRKLFAYLTATDSSVSYKDFVSNPINTIYENAKFNDNFREAYLYSQHKKEKRTYLNAEQIVEVGAGTGSFSEFLLREKLETLALIEPSEMFQHLEENVSQIETDAKVTYHQAIFAQVCDSLAASDKPDSIIYVNVMEHIEDDSGELEMIYRTLVPGGRCFIFVPALMSLYGEFDRKIGHFRRYTKTELEEKCKKAGFKIAKSKHFDFAGIFPWFVKYKLLKSDSLESGAVTLYDKIAVPVIQKFEKILPMPVGKNLLVIAEK